MKTGRYRQMTREAPPIEAAERRQTVAPGEARGIDVRVEKAPEGRKISQESVAPPGLLLDTESTVGAVIDRAYNPHFPKSSWSLFEKSSTFVLLMTMVGMMICLFEGMNDLSPFNACVISLMA